VYGIIYRKGRAIREEKGIRKEFRKGREPQKEQGKLENGRTEVERKRKNMKNFRITKRRRAIRESRGS
jgi:hypothetical protein